MQFDLSSGLWGAHVVTAILLFTFFTVNSLKEKKINRKKEDIYLVMFLYGFVPLWFQIVVWFVALIFLILPAALSQLPSVVSKLMTCYTRMLKPGLAERFTFTVGQKEQRSLSSRGGWKDIANILTITCFPGCFLQVDALCYCTSSCQLTRQHLFLYVRSSVV